MSAEGVRSALWGDGAARTRTLLALAFLVACIVYLLVVRASGIETEVIRDRYWLDAEPLFHGEFPATEYPPLAMVFFAIPRLFGSSPWGYETAYVAMMWAFMVLGLLMADRTARDLGYSRGRAMGLYSLLVLLLLEFVLDRFDMIVAVFVIASLMFFAEGRSRMSFLMLAIATLLKVVPAVLFPVLLIALVAQGRRRDALEGALLYIMTGAAVMAVFWLVEPDSVTSFLDYNSDRPLQIESVAASFLYPLSMMGVSDMWIQSADEEGSHLSDNLRGSLPDDVASVLLPVTCIAVLAVWALYAWRERRGPSGGIAMMAFACLAAMLMFLVTNKVFSSQYLLWLVGPVLLVLMTSGKREGRAVLRLTVAVIVLTQLNFAYNVGYLGGGANIDDLGMMILLVRSVVCIALLLLCLRPFLRGTGPVDGSMETTGNGYM